MQSTSKTTPLMQQFFKIKEQLSDSLLFFQVGDFYELFFDDAKTSAQFLGIALTKRGTHNGESIPLCGVPLHASDFYIAKLVRGGFKVAVCDQLEEAQPGKVVDRGVTRVFTPGTLTDSKLLDDKSPSYLAVVLADGSESKITLLFGELLTGQLYGCTIEDHGVALESELARFHPSEVLLDSSRRGKRIGHNIKKLGYFCTVVPTSLGLAESDDMFRSWAKRFGVSPQSIHMLQALYLFYTYLKDHNSAVLALCKDLQWYNAQDYLVLDAATQKNLELVKNSVDSSTKHTLFDVLDQAMTPMGSRTIKKWLARPLINQKKIEARYKVVESLIEYPTLLSGIREQLKSVGDLERVIGRMALGRATLHDYGSLQYTLAVIPGLAQQLADSGVKLLNVLAGRFMDFTPLNQLLEAAINTDSHKDLLIKDGFDEELDRLRSLVSSSTSAIAALEKKEQDATGINSLKIRYTGAHGYYIEVTKTNLHLVPEHYQRSQTLVGRERFTTQELKNLEQEVERAHREINAVEKEVFDRVKREVLEYLSPLQKASQALCYLDALASFAGVAYHNQYVKPVFNQQREIVVENARHPVVEQLLENQFIPNNIMLTGEQSFWIITGPNMGGKSTLLRQTALICIMAQIGSFVPARSATLPIVDRIFTRIGASDKVSQGKSTFLVEMEETALICRQATKNSLVILDEVGRGTSTYDGLAIAQAVVEYLHGQLGARGLFATHYHELTELEKDHAGIVSYHAASSRHEDRLVFLYKIVRGNADGSFGIDVAELAELPDNVIMRAREIHKKLSL